MYITHIPDQFMAVDATREQLQLHVMRSMVTHIVMPVPAVQILLVRYITSAHVPYVAKLLDAMAVLGVQPVIIYIQSMKPATLWAVV